MMVIIKCLHNLKSIVQKKRQKENKCYKKNEPCFFPPHVSDSLKITDLPVITQSSMCKNPS